MTKMPTSRSERCHLVLRLVGLPANLTMDGRTPSCTTLCTTSSESGAWGERRGTKGWEQIKRSHMIQGPIHPRSYDAHKWSHMVQGKRSHDAHKWSHTVQGKRSHDAHKWSHMIKGKRSHDAHKWSHMVQGKRSHDAHKWSHMIKGKRSHDVHKWSQVAYCTALLTDNM